MADRFTQQDLDQQLDTLIADAKTLKVNSYRMTRFEIDRALARLKERIDYAQEKV